MANAETFSQHFHIPARKRAGPLREKSSLGPKLFARGDILDDGTTSFIVSAEQSKVEKGRRSGREGNLPKRNFAKRMRERGKDLLLFCDTQWAPDLPGSVMCFLGRRHLDDNGLGLGLVESRQTGGLARLALIWSIAANDHLEGEFEARSWLLHGTVGFGVSVGSTAFVALISSWCTTNLSQRCRPT